MSFETLGLAEPLLRAVRDAGYTTATPIQTAAIPPAVAGRDVLGCAQTGTGKTAAFVLPILQRMAAAGGPRGPRPVRALVLTPTRELAAQIGENARIYGKHLQLSSAVIFGGVGQYPQEQALRRGVDLLIATPGRLLDLMNQRIVSLANVSFFVLDEADRMLDMGFIHDVRRIVATLPKERQTLFFSATMPNEIVKLSSTLLKDPVRVEVAPVSSSAETVEQWVHFVDQGSKQPLLEHLLRQPAVKRALVFTRTKHGADRVARKLSQSGIASEAIHGNKSQNQRTRALEAFKKGTVRVMVASDIAARGLDIDEITHVFNFEIPNEPETYVHRIGRTGRAGNSGIAIALCGHDERAFLRDIERLIGKKVPVAGAVAGVVPERAHPEAAAHGHAPRQGDHRFARGNDQRGGRHNGGGRGDQRGGDQRGGRRIGRPTFNGGYQQPRPAAGHQAPRPAQPAGDQAAPAQQPAARPAFKRKGPPPPTW
ncbi:MAG TPA: DEAD/DEAH box helicase [Planctomycetota bacterium]|nr:DEAD/DEAH box helicase [Planctomycetota bacterium]